MTEDLVMTNTAEALPTMAEFLAWEDRQDRRYEYADGIVRAMVGTTVGNNRIVRNLASSLDRQCGARGCGAYTESIRVPLSTRLYYPDVVFTCAPVRDDTNAIPEPLLIAEVLSKSTELIDRIEKLNGYRTIETLRYYLIVAQDIARVDVHARDEVGWSHVGVAPPDRSVVLPDIGAEIPLAELYAGTSVAVG
jgi:Uma2 family endonuclease